MLDAHEGVLLGRGMLLVVHVVEQAGNSPSLLLLGGMGPGSSSHAGGDAFHVDTQCRVFDPFAQSRAAVDHVDRQSFQLVLVREVAPEVVVRVQRADRLEGERLQPPGAELVVIVERPFRVDHQTVAQLARMLVEGRLEPAFAQGAASQPAGGDAMHFGEHRLGVDIGRAEQHFERAGGAASFGNAIASRWPILDREELQLPDRGDGETRTALSVSVEAPVGEVSFTCTHLNWRLHHGEVRERQVVSLADFVLARRPKDGFPPIVVGDFNADPESDEIRFMTGHHSIEGKRVFFHDAWRAAGGEGSGMTWSNRRWALVRCV